MSETDQRPVPCPKCGQAMREDKVKSVMWHQEQMLLVEDIPAMVCDNCGEQYYDDEITEAMLRLTEQNFPWAEKTREIVVPVYTIKRRPRAKPDEMVWPDIGANDQQPKGE